MREAICYAVVYLAEAAILWLYCERLFPRRRSLGWILLGILAGYSGLFLIYRWNIPIWNALAFLLVTFGVIAFGYRCKIKTALLQAAVLTVLMMAAELAGTLLLYALDYSFAAYTQDFFALVVLSVSSKLIYLIFALISSRFFASEDDGAEEPRLMALICAVPVLSVLLAVWIDHAGLAADFPEEVGQIVLVCVLALLVFNLVLAVLYNHLRKANAEAMALRLSRLREEADAAYYQAMQEQAENQRILIHDIKNHLQAIDGLAREAQPEEITRYIAQLQQFPILQAQAKLCDNSILNLVLLHFRQVCREKEISFSWDVRSGCTEFLSEACITALYGNLLSNAVEAATASREKWVELSVYRNPQQGFVWITISNSCDTAPISDGKGYFSTRKADRALHGAGLRSIDRVVREYHGILTRNYDAANYQFRCVIQFPSREAGNARA